MVAGAAIHGLGRAAAPMGDFMSSIARPMPRDRVRWAFFLLVAAGTVLAVSADERFLIDFHDPEWKHIAAFKWWLLLHGLAGATAFCIGPFQFSDTLRRTRTRLHRWMGRIYVGAVFVAAPVALYIGTRFEQPLLAAEQPAQAGFWMLTTAMALICVLRGNIPAHRAWMMRSYAFALVFMTSRVPDAFGVQWTDATLTNFLWYLLALALVGPDLVLTTRELWRKRAKG
jgi:uncharacterized membrane protein